MEPKIKKPRATQSESHSVWRKKNLHKRAEYMREWRKNNPGRTAEQRRQKASGEWQAYVELRAEEAKKNRRLCRNLRSRIRQSLVKGTFAGRKPKTEALLGCCMVQFRQHMESLFQPGMSWENYGKNGWHIDHIMPVSSFDLTNLQEVKRASHFSNLQPLWAADNQRKSNKIIT